MGITEVDRSKSFSRRYGTRYAPVSSMLFSQQFELVPGLDLVALQAPASKALTSDVQLTTAQSMGRYPERRARLRSYIRTHVDRADTKKWCSNSCQSQRPAYQTPATNITINDRQSNVHHDFER